MIQHVAMTLTKFTPGLPFPVIMKLQATDQTFDEMMIQLNIGQGKVQQTEHTLHGRI